VPSLAEYVAGWGLNTERLDRACPEAWILHPGPANEGVEISAELATAPRSLIGRQVENGVPIRMAVLSLLAEAR
jgi:aspartate carbamoyltransferase catalytic subunit